MSNLDPEATPFIPHRMQPYYPPPTHLMPSPYVPPVRGMPPTFGDVSKRSLNPSAPAFVPGSVSVGFRPGSATAFPTDSRVQLPSHAFPHRPPTRAFVDTSPSPSPAPSPAPSPSPAPPKSTPETTAPGTESWASKLKKVANQPVSPSPAVDVSVSPSPKGELAPAATAKHFVSKETASPKGPKSKPASAAGPRVPKKGVKPRKAAVSGDGTRLRDRDRDRDREKASKQKLTTEAITEPKGRDAAAREPMTRETIAKDAAAKETAVKEAAVTDAADKEMAPKEVAPKEVAPKEVAPKEVAPREASPKESAPLPSVRSWAKIVGSGVSSLSPTAPSRPPVSPSLSPAPGGAGITQPVSTKEDTAAKARVKPSEPSTDHVDKKPIAKADATVDSIEAKQEVQQKADTEDKAETGKVMETQMAEETEKLVEPEQTAAIKEKTGTEAEIKTKLEVEEDSEIVKEAEIEEKLETEEKAEKEEKAEPDQKSEAEAKPTIDAKSGAKPVYSATDTGVNKTILGPTKGVFSQQLEDDDFIDDYRRPNAFLGGRNYGLKQKLHSVVAGLGSYGSASLDKLDADTKKDTTLFRSGPAAVRDAAAAAAETKEADHSASGGAGSFTYFLSSQQTKVYKIEDMMSIRYAPQCTQKKPPSPSALFGMRSTLTSGGATASFDMPLALGQRQRIDRILEDGNWNVKKDTPFRTHSATQELPWARRPVVEVPELPKDSWQATQAESKSTDDRAVKLGRRLRAQLNKMTPATYNDIYKVILDIGIQTTEEAQLFVNLIFEKAITNHQYIDMYARLCGDLQENLERDGGVFLKDSPNNFRRLLLQCCQTAFDNNLAKPFEAPKDADEEEKFELLLLHKRKMKGNLVFVSALSMHHLLGGKVLLSILQRLTENKESLQLEALAAFLPTASSSLEASSRFKDSFVELFDKIRALSEDPEVEHRIRCLLLDCVEQRDRELRRHEPQDFRKVHSHGGAGGFSGLTKTRTHQ
eukprot:Gregarina_sp_Poly_1__744@NODE_1179_length_4854_cov_304_497598_g809_i0_p1_GENE_NODE_1179_length_4854_cov_304_497598_g809_i0NODE_1179_length_4854_cov_304_497598_g809_i0_p1_ORF_typecomplete_len988_score233_50MIF4G/PF02854_19/1_5e34PAM2/PF07145_15/3_4e03PAM2/PF07145_15/0_01PAM2/PF07145_15/1_2e04AspBHydro_N/PF05279_11/22AspBHydro_N/PF05279_11/0_041_NODE_1179_length_4854_cov_304_497598_g809_i01383101